MKKILFSALILAGFSATAQVKVGDNPTTINNSALLEMESTSKGLLMSRMTTAQRTAIASPANGLQVFDTDTKSFWHFDATALPAPGKWIEGTNNSNAKWIDGKNAGEIVLNNTTGVDSVMFKNNGLLKFQPYSFEAFNTATNATYETRNFNNTGNEVSILNGNYSKLSTITPISTRAGRIFNLFTGVVDAASEADKNPMNLSANIFVEKSNTNNYGFIQGLSNLVNHSGSGKVGSIQSIYSFTAVGADAEVTDIKNISSYVKSASTKANSNIYSYDSDIQLTGNGTVGSVVGTKSRFQIVSSKTTGNIGKYYGFSTEVYSPATYTGTLGETVDFYGGTNQASSSTKKYGLYITDTSKSNYVEGNIVVGKFTASTPNVIKDNYGLNGVIIEGQDNFQNGLYFGTRTGRTGYMTSNSYAGIYLTTPSTLTVNPWDERGSMVFQTRPDSPGRDFAFVSGTTPTVKFFIEEAGNVGVGTTTPATKLDVAGTIKIGNSNDATPQKGMIRFNSTTNKFQGFVDVANDTSDGTADGWVDLH